MSDARRFDSIERVVRDERRRLDDLASTVLARLGLHTHIGDVVGESRYAFTTADQTVTNSAVMVNITNYVLSMSANASYIIEGFLHWTAPVTQAIKLTATFPAGCTIKWRPGGNPNTVGSRIGDHHTGVANTSTSGGLIFALTGDAAGTPSAQLIGFIRTGGTAGDLRYQYAQNTAGAATSAVMLRDSWLKLTRVA